MWDGTPGKVPILGWDMHLLSLGDGECGPMSSCLPPQVITLEGWVDIMYYVMDAHSFYNFIYFILLIIVSVGVTGWWASRI